MTRAFIFLFLFGTIVLIGIFLSLFWGGLAIRRKRLVGGKWKLSSDRYFVLALSVAMFAFGLTISYMGRLIGNLLYGLSALIQHDQAAWLIGSGLSFVIIGSAGMVWLADLESRRVTWKWCITMLLLTLGWAVAALFITPYIPFVRG
jgi:hypothetical protein